MLAWRRRGDVAKVGAGTTAGAWPGASDPSDPIDAGDPSGSSEAASGPGPWLVDGVRADGTAVVLVLGLQWHTVLGRDLVRQARRRAAQLGATHWVHAGGRSESVGVLLRPGRRLTPRLRWPRASHAAAQALARHLSAGSHIAVLDVPGRPGQAWLAVVKDGRVVEGGEWQGPVGEALDRVWQAWRVALPGAAAWGRVEHLTAAAGIVLQPLDWTDLGASLGADSLLQTRRRPIWAVLATVSMVVAAAPWMYRTLTPAPAPAALTATMVEAGPADPAALWRDVYDDWLESTRMTTPAGLDLLAHAVLAVPLSPAGWHFVQATCRAGESAWHCAAEYRRPPGPARQAGLVAALPPQWRLVWRGLDEAEARWTVTVPTRALQREDLEPDPVRWVPEADLLLGLAPIWQGMDVGRRRGLDLSPAVPVGGVLPQRPLDWPRVGVRELTLLGPLRSFSLFPSALARRTVWQSLELRHLPGQPLAIDRSALMLTLKGLAYERVPHDVDMSS